VNEEISKLDRTKKRRVPPLLKLRPCNNDGPKPDVLFLDRRVLSGEMPAKRDKKESVFNSFSLEQPKKGKKKRKQENNQQETKKKLLVGW